MAKEESIEMDGIVAETLPNTMEAVRDLGFVRLSFEAQQHLE
jgi:translation initiation factor IF-1